MADKFHALSPGHQFAASELLGILKTDIESLNLTGSICNMKDSETKQRPRELPAKLFARTLQGKRREGLLEENVGVSLCGMPEGYVLGVEQSLW